MTSAGVEASDGSLRRGWNNNPRGPFLCVQLPRTSMTTGKKLLLLAPLILTPLAFSSTSASARIVCNVDGDCWHVHEDYTYRPDWGLTVHRDNWKWKEGKHFSWREHKGRGYWKGGNWEEF
jgi:hypothetical protein